MAECLYHSSNIEEYSLGANLLKTSKPRHLLIRGVHVIRHHATVLRDTKDTGDQQSVKAVNDFFKHNDYRVANDDLKHALDIPLEKNIIDWLSIASDHDIEQFCIWSLDRTRQLTKAVQRDKQELIGHALHKTNELVSNGLFPPTAVPVIRAATKRYFLQGMDSFHGVGLDRIAFCGDYTIGVSNLYLNRYSMTIPTREMQRTMFHEYIHGGGNDRGFFNGITFQHYNRIMEEAFVEHATVVAHSTFIKQPWVIDPHKRITFLESNRGVYGAERTFLAAICDHTNIAVEQLSEAYFSPRGDERGEQLRNDIERKIGNFFGSRKNFYDFIDAYENEDSSKRSQMIRSKLNELRLDAN